MQPARRIPKPRLYHTKSRTGCTRCRARRVKCNEVRPVCNNCHRHNVSCRYDRVPAPPTTITTTEARTGRPPSIAQIDVTAIDEDVTPCPSASVPQITSPGHGYWDLRAFHHFAVATSGTLPGSHLPGVRSCWADQVPVLALSYQPLWNQLLALSALHLISSGHDNTELVACRTAFLDASLEAYRPALAQLGPDTAEAACFTSILLLVDTFATLQDRQLDHYEPPMHWLRVTQGARAVFEVATTTTPSSNIMTVIASSNHNQGAASAESKRRFAHLLAPFPDEPALNSMTEDATQAYQETIDRLCMIHAAVEAGEPQLALCRRFMSFACLVPPLFVHLVEQKAPRALVILGHFFAMSASVTGLWWVGQTPAREVRAIYDALPQGLRDLMEWPCRYLACYGKTDVSDAVAIDAE